MKRHAKCWRNWQEERSTTEIEYTITVLSARDKTARYQCSSVSEQPEEMASNIVSVFMFFQEGLKWKTCIFGP